MRVSRSGPSLAVWCVAGLLLVACESRNPAAVASPQDEGDGAEAPSGEAPASANAPAKRAAPKPARPEPKSLLLADSREAAAVDPATLTPYRRLDLETALTTGDLEITVDDPVLAPHVGELVDGDTDSLLRSSGINPLTVKLLFLEPIEVRAVRILATYSSYDWSLQVGDGDPWVLRTTPDKEWSAVAFDEPQVGRSLELVLLRLQRDDYVHLNEIEVLVEAGS